MIEIAYSQQEAADALHAIDDWQWTPGNEHPTNREDEDANPMGGRRRTLAQRLSREIDRIASAHWIRLTMARGRNGVAR